MKLRPSIAVALLFVGVWFIGKLIFFYTGSFQTESGVKVLVMWNMLCLLSGMSLGTYIEKRKEARAESTALNDIKNAMVGGVIYTAMVGVLLYTYYSKIDPGYNERQIVVAEQKIKEALEDKKEKAEILRIRPEYEAMTNEEIFAELRKNPRAMFNPGSTMTLALLAMLVLTTLNAILLTVIYRRILFKNL